MLLTRATKQYVKTQRLTQKHVNYPMVKYLCENSQRLLVANVFWQKIYIRDDLQGSKYASESSAKIKKFRSNTVKELKISITPEK